ncbi:MAG: T9SS type A sorting domain-containing protein [Bacteroidales bacterium]
MKKMKMYPLVLVFLSFSISMPQLMGQHSTTAYCWESPIQSVPKIIQPCWVYKDYGPSWSFNMNNISGIASHLQSMPQGKRCIQIWNSYFMLHDYPADQLKDSVTNQVKGYIDTLNIFHPFPTVWWDSGVAYAAQFHENFFHSLYLAGANIDMVVMDDEYAVGNFHIENNVFAFPIHTYERDSVSKLYYNAIMSDSRFPSLSSALGFSNLLWVYDWMNHEEAQMKFNDYWTKKRTEYLTTAIVNPLHNYFPSAKFSNFQDAHSCSEYPVGIDGYKNYKYGLTWTHTGTHQNEWFYGWLGALEYGILPDSVTYMPYTSYNVLLFETNRMKAIRKCNPAPLIGWIAYPSCGPGNLTAYTNSPYYFENIFHLLLSGSDDVLFWNPTYYWGSTFPLPAIHLQEAQQLSNALYEFDSFWNTSIPDSNLFYPDDTITPWNRPYVLTGMSSDSLKLWRFSPRLDSTILQPIDFLTSTSPLSFNVYGSVVSFPPGAYVSSIISISDRGLWIVSPTITTGGTISLNNILNNSFRIHPNPTPDAFMITGDLHNSAEYIVNIYNVFGAQVINEIKVQGQKQINVTNLQDGMYVVEIECNNVTVKQKLIIQR